MGETRFELVKVEPPDLQSGSFSHSEILPDGYGRVRTDDLQVKSPLLYQLSYVPIKGLNFQGSLGSRSPTDSSNIPPFGLWEGTGGALAELSQAIKKGEEPLVSPLIYLFLWLVLTSDLPYPQTGEYPQYANSGNQDY